MNLANVLRNITAKKQFEKSFTSNRIFQNNLPTQLKKIKSHLKNNLGFNCFIFYHSDKLTLYEKEILATGQKTNYVVLILFMEQNIGLVAYEVVIDDLIITSSFPVNFCMYYSLNGLLLVLCPFSKFSFNQLRC